MIKMLQNHIKEIVNLIFCIYVFTSFLREETFRHCLSMTLSIDVCQSIPNKDVWQLFWSVFE